MGQINIGNMPKYRIDYEYETWRTDKEYWLDKFEEIRNSFEWKCPTQQTLAKFQYELHRWQMYVNMVLHITNTEAITVSFDFETNTLHINMNEELQKLFN